jgi:predicted phosphate transport protein (TIGR00153 family)
MKRIINFFMPKEDIFFDLLKNQSKIVCETGTLFGKFLRDYDELSFNAKKKRLKAITDSEEKGDDLTHEIVGLPHKSFITPIDREDIHELTNLLDNLIDLMDDISNKLLQFEVEEIPKDLFDLCVVSIKALNEVHLAVSCLKKPKNISFYLISIHNFEDEGDRIYFNAINGLFKKEKNAVKIIKLKDLYEKVENLLDECQQIAIVLEGIVVKHA